MIIVKRSLYWSSDAKREKNVAKSKDCEKSGG